MQSFFIGLGGNQGSVADAFHAAIRELEAFPEIDVRRVSSFHLTPPMGEDAGDSYLNAAVELQTSFPPLELLDALQSVETRHGRVRSTRWSPRTLDLDLLLHGETLLDHPRLTLPHPGCWYRRFVLDPLVEIAPDALHPLKGATIKELQVRLLKRPLTVGIQGGEAGQRSQIVHDLTATFSDILVDSRTGDENRLPSLLFWLGPGKQQNVGFENLPLLPRLDLTRFPEDAMIAARNVIKAALGS